MMLADGARADVFERLLKEGDLPNVARHVVERGGYRRATSTFTSTTGPAHLPLLTGCFAGTANLPGYRWFDRRAYRPGLPLGPWCLRSYSGPEAMLVNRDLDPSVRTVFEVVREPLSAFGVLTRGVPAANNLWRRRRVALYVHSHYRADYDRCDRAAAAALLDVVRRSGEFGFVGFLGVDWNSHYASPFGPETEAAYRRFDRAVGAAADALIEAGRYDSTLLVVSSDHGHQPVEHHFDLPVRLQERGLRVAYHPRRVGIRHPDAVACVSGNGMAQVYALSRERPGEPLDREDVDATLPGVREWLLEQPAVDIVATRCLDGVCVESRRGRALVSEVGGALRYRAQGADPFGFAPLPEELSFEEALEATAAGPYPDGLVQIAQLFRASRCGDLVVSAARSHDLRCEHPEHRSGHGALHAEHMTVPLAVSAALSSGPMRTADVFPTVLEWLRRPVPPSIDGVSRLAGPRGHVVSALSSARYSS